MTGGPLFVGGMDGAWKATAKGWQALPTGSEETTAIILVDRHVAIATAAGVHFVNR
jgi:hypothetical protein